MEPRGRDNIRRISLRDLGGAEGWTLGNCMRAGQPSAHEPSRRRKVKSPKLTVRGRDGRHSWISTYSALLACLGRRPWLSCASEKSQTGVGACDGVQAKGFAPLEF